MPSIIDFPAFSPAPPASRTAIALNAMRVPRRVASDLLLAVTIVVSALSAWTVTGAVEWPAPSGHAPTAHAAQTAFAFVMLFSAATLAIRAEVDIRPGGHTLRLAVNAVLAFGLASVACGVRDVSLITGLGATIGLVTALAHLGLGACLTGSPLNERIRRRVAVYGASTESAAVFMDLADRGSEIRLVGLFDERSDPVRQALMGIPVEGGLDRLLALARAGEVDDVVIALPYRASDRIANLAAHLNEFPVSVLLPLEMVCDVPAPGTRFTVTSIGTVKVACIQQRPLDGWGMVGKTLQDRLGAVVALVLLAPLFALIGLAIKLDSPGPVYFRQMRQGLAGQPISVWKFRTMHVLEDGLVVHQAGRHDPRVTRVGRWLRGTSLDELPQLINVALGEMSIVGPRPHAVAHNLHYAGLIETYTTRQQMKPGITGWAQINGYRGETDDPKLMEKRVEYDLWYIRNWSIWLDLRIILMTPIYGLVHKNAY